MYPLAIATYLNEAVSSGGRPVLALAATAGGIDNLDSPPPEISGGLSAAGSLAWVFVALLIVIGLILFVIRFLAGRSKAWGTNRSLRQLGGVALGQNKSLQVVEIGGRLYVVGVGEDVTLLDRIDDPEEAERLIRILDQPQQALWNTSGFGEVLTMFRRRQEQGKGAEHRSEDNFESLLRHSMDRQADRKQKIESLIKDSAPKDRLMDE